MEMRYPILILIGTIAILCILFIPKRKKGKYKDGTKIANTSYVKNTPYYKKKLNTYKWLIRAIKIMMVVSLFSCSILLSRPINVDTIIPEEYNRDIVLCMDVSGSLDKLNYEMTTYLQDTVSSLEGERFAITIFNSSASNVVPMTDDYDFVMDSLQKFSNAYNLSKEMPEYGEDGWDDYMDSRDYITAGTWEGNRGMSLIGDGLAACVYTFPKLEETKRTRIIILTTDNALAGDPLLTLEEAAQLAKKYGVILYGIEPKDIRESSNNNKEFLKAANITGGKLYSAKDDDIKNIIKDIEKTSESLIEKKEIIVRTDIPKIPFIILFTSIIVMIIIRKKVKV